MTRFIYYCLSGGIAFSVHLLVLTVLVEFFYYEEALATMAGFIAAWPVNFLLQRRVVFQVEDKSGTRFFRYSAVTFLTFFLNAGLFVFLTNILAIYYVTAQFLTTIVILLVNFWFNTKWTFHTEEGKDGIS